MGLQELTKTRGSGGPINFLVNHAGHLVMTTLAILHMTRLRLNWDSSPTASIDTGASVFGLLLEVLCQGSATGE